MTDSEPRPPTSFWHRRIPGIRYIYPVAALVGGLLFLIRYAVTASAGESDHAWWLVAGIALLVVAAASIPLYWWMDRRGM